MAYPICRDACAPDNTGCLAACLLCRLSGLFGGFHGDGSQDVGESALAFGARNLLTIDSVRSRILDFTGRGPNGPEDARQACAIHRAASLLSNKASLSFQASYTQPGAYQLTTHAHMCASITNSLPSNPCLPNKTKLKQNRTQPP